MWNRRLIFLVTAFALISCTEGLRCVSCTYITTKADVPDIVKLIINAFQNPKCSEENIDESTPGITTETCNAPEGKESKCGYYKGELKVDVDLIVTQTTVPVSVYQRGCYDETPTMMPSDGCHDHKNVQSDRNVFQKILDRFSSALTSLDFINFTGKLCVCSTQYCTKYTSGSPQNTISPALLCLVFVMKLIF